jgi:hypothetical protein
VYSQNLNFDDIDIFINGSEKITDILINIDPNNDVWRDYAKQFIKVHKYFDDNLLINIRENEINNLENDFREFIDFRIPDEFVSTFESIGWKINGHKKYWIIKFGADFLHYLKYIKDSEKENIQKSMMLKLIGENDLEIIETRIDEINNLFEYE